ncbi:hypothetical protein [Catellatospora sichuanensis]|uniref:hypothetical protein n=1 Tax=Catellatospora sichuanensis TaxID=1969805 RepID=UPI0011827952|nr:hypothetical protein [Catellatospora sichuanensis]
MGQNMFSIVDLLGVAAVALALGALATVVFLSSTAKELCASQAAAGRQRRQTMKLPRLAEQSGGVTSDTWVASCCDGCSLPGCR